MSVRLSTGLCKFLAAGGSIRKALNDFVLDIYQGTQPTSPDSAPGSLKLWRITYNSGAWSASVAQKDSVTITSATAAQTQIFTFDDGTVCTYTNGAGETTTTVAAGCALMLNTQNPNVIAVSVGAVVYIQSKFPGAAYTLTMSGTGSPGATSSITANSAGNGLRWLAAASDTTGIYIPKQAVTWSGLGLAAGNAGWARLQYGTDDETTSTTAIRLDLACSTSSTDLQMSSLTAAVGIPNQITVFNIRVPKQ